MFRTADGLGVNKVYLSGYSPYPLSKDDKRLPHVAKKADKQIDKTALGAQRTVNWAHEENIDGLIGSLKSMGFKITALEQAKNAEKIENFRPDKKQVLVVGNEVDGIENMVLALCDNFVEIPMLGNKESFNVSVAAAIAMHEIAKIHKML